MKPNSVNPNPFRTYALLEDDLTEAYSASNRSYPKILQSKINKL